VPWNGSPLTPACLRNINMPSPDSHLSSEAAGGPGLIPTPAAKLPGAPA
jgi:hypothetical protein